MSTPTQRAAKAAANAQATATAAGEVALVAAHAMQAAFHQGAAATATNQISAELHARAAERHETAAADQAAWFETGDPDESPGMTAQESSKAWLLSSIAYMVDTDPSI